ncbi:MAG TPA: FlgD immunoglobulin-like domain containing protein [bacterium]|nr:FlgD immunoglobulin-like domain containing protein [bacterium]
MSSEGRRVRQKLIRRCLIGFLFFSLSPVQSDDLHFQTVVVRNDGMRDGEFHLELQGRIASGVQPRRLAAFTCDLYYGDALQEAAGDPALFWAADLEQGYRRQVSKLPGFYRILAALELTASDSSRTPAVAGMQLNSQWRTLVTLRWTIRELADVDLLVADKTVAAAFVDNAAGADDERLFDYQVAGYAGGEVALAVELAFFSVSRQTDHILLHWATRAEENHMGFYVYRAESTAVYQKISPLIVPCSSPSPTKKDYYFQDRTIQANQTYYYRLADVARDGHVHYHAPVRIETAKPEDYALEQNYPNPFNAQTRLNFSLPEPGPVELFIYNLKGQRVRALLQRSMEPGRHFVLWDGCDDAGAPLASGIYLAGFRTHLFSQVRKLQLIR